ncbi:hypothetical protein PC119_g26775 [Phytophthora cactorum]|uniref:Uncharacterized protein n=1 Tax=Phytophthora cactorum TaxID=29920 RepID=A0A8T1AG92_9STRA|nr:hypothetical protein PC117_g26939 [Phytophthora cactorum]KAG2959235.1 hypothetical protein PC119_g26775 [Phytophthora cactorum]
MATAAATISESAFQCIIVVERCLMWMKAGQLNNERSDGRHSGAGQGGAMAESEKATRQTYQLDFSQSAGVHTPNLVFDPYGSVD